MTRSALEGVPGLGPARRTRLLREFGSLQGLRAASLEDLRALPWLPDAVAGGRLRPSARPRRPGREYPVRSRRCPPAWARMGVGPVPSTEDGPARGPALRTGDT